MRVIGLILILVLDHSIIFGNPVDSETVSTTDEESTDEPSTDGSAENPTTEPVDEVESSTEPSAEVIEDPNNVTTENPEEVTKSPDGVTENSVDVQTESPGEVTEDADVGTEIPDNDIDSSKNKEKAISPTKKSNCNRRRRSLITSASSPKEIPASKSVAQLSWQLFNIYGWLSPKWVYYGNYCGYNGAQVGGRDGQNNPIDECDKCCQVHDDCYDCVGECNAYFFNYNYDWGGKSFICKDQHSTCGYKTCECDRVLVECLTKLC